MDFSRVDLSQFRVPATGNYQAGRSHLSSYPLVADQILAQTTTLPSLNMSLPTLSMGSMPGSSYHGSPYNAQPQLHPDSVQLTSPYADTYSKGSMLPIDPTLLNMGGSSDFFSGYSSTVDPMYASNAGVFSSSLDASVYEMLGGPLTPLQPSAPNSTALQTSQLPSLHFESPSPVAYSPHRTVSPSQLMCSQQAQPSLTSPQPSLVYSFGSGTSSRSGSRSPPRPRSRSVSPTNPVVSISRSASRRPSPGLS